MEDKQIVINDYDFNKINQIENILKSYVEQSCTSVEGYYMNSSGVAVSSISRKYIIYNVSKNSIKITSTINGSAVFLAIYKDSNNVVLGTQFQGIDGLDTTYTEQLLTIPENTTSIVINGNINKITIIKKLELIDRALFNGDVLDIKNKTNILTNKTALFLGTSITEGSLFPVDSMSILGGTGINKGVGSSTVRISKADGSYTGLAWQNYCYALSHTLAEKNTIISNWDTIKVSLTNSPPATLDSTTQTFIRNCSYELRLLPYLNGTLTMPDYFIFEHGRNDNFSSDTDNDFKTIPTIRNDRRYYLGAMNYLFDLILQYNPYAKILIFGHYENDLLTRVSEAQLVCADYWNIPICKTWEKSGFSQQIVIGSQALWVTSPYNLYTAGQNTANDMNVQRVNLPDGIHPSSATNGKAQTTLINIAVQFLRNNY